MCNGNSAEPNKVLHSSIWHKLKNDWSTALSGLLSPLVFVPIVITISSLYFANIHDIDKRFPLVLNIISSISLAFAGSFFYDIVISPGKSLLQKKGLSAVRNLSLARTKIKKISRRVDNDGSKEEVVNLLSMLEIDIANATQEWNDILPRVDKIEEVYVLLDEKEDELKNTIEEKERLNSQLTNQKQLGDSERNNLTKKVAEYEKKISDLNNEISILSIKTSSPNIGLVDLPKFQGAVLGPIIEMDNHCKQCGKIYKRSRSNAVSLLLGDRGLCNDCEQKN